MQTNREAILTCSLRELNVEDNINTIRNAIYDGAEAFMLHLEKLEECYHNKEDLRKLFNYAADKPVFSVNYRTHRRPNKTDEELVEGQLIALEAGAEVLDIFADLYCPSFDEITYDEEAIRKQKELINKVHELGGKVMLSSHTFRFLTCEETIKHLKELESRGADMVKIAVTASSKEELDEVNRTTIWCLSYYELCTFGAIPTALSVSYADSSPRGRAKSVCKSVKQFDKREFEDGLRPCWGMIFIPQQSLWVQSGILACKVGLCTVTVCKEGFAQSQQGAGLFVAVGIGTVLQSAGYGCIPCIDLHRDYGAELRG